MGTSHGQEQRYFKYLRYSNGIPAQDKTADSIASTAKATPKVIDTIPQQLRQPNSPLSVNCLIVPGVQCPCVAGSREGSQPLSPLDQSLFSLALCTATPLCCIEEGLRAAMEPSGLPSPRSISFHQSAPSDEECCQYVCPCVKVGSRTVDAASIDRLCWQQ